MCTEYMARPAGSTFDPNLGYLKEQGIGAYNWGFVDGKSQTAYPWDSWKKPYDKKPDTWFHDIFHDDGKPYDPKEVAYIRQLTGKGTILDRGPGRGRSLPDPQARDDPDLAVERRFRLATLGEVDREPEHLVVLDAQTPRRRTCHRSCCTLSVAGDSSIPANRC